MTSSLVALPRMIIPRLWNHHHLRRYRRQIGGAWELSLFARYLPGLARLPLPLRPVGTEESGCSLIEALDQQPWLRITSGVGTGRSLALRQLPLLWAQGQLDLGERVPLLLDLPCSPPEPNEALTAALAGAGFDYSPPAVGRSLNAGEFILLLDGWDELPAPLQAQWQQWLQGMARRFPRIGLVVVTGEVEDQDWLPFAPWELLPPDPPLLSAWLRHLLPDTDPEIMVAPLVVDERLHPLGRRLLEITLLAWTYPRYGFPPNRSQLYARALDQLLRHECEGDVRKLRSRLAQLGFEALQMRVPPQASPDLHFNLRKLNGFTELHADGRLFFGHRAWPAFLAAVHITEAERMPLLNCSDPVWREAIALAAGLLDDPTPLYQACRNSRSTPVELTLALGGALREHRRPLRGWSELILGNLARLSAMSRVEALEARSILEDVPGILAEAIARSLDGDQRAVRWALDTLRWLPAHLGAPHLVDLLADSSRDPAQRREAAEILLTYPEQTTLVPVGALAQTNLDQLGRLLVTALLSLGGPAGRQFLAMLDGRGIRLFPEPIGEGDHQLQARAALALLEDHALDRACLSHAADALAAALNKQSVELILKGCVSASRAARHASRRALLSADRKLALGSFARLVLGSGITWEAQSEALQELALLSDPFVPVILARALRNEDLPLAGRVQAAGLLLERGEPGLEKICKAVEDPAITPVLRARLVGMLAEAGWQPVLNVLLNLVCVKAQSPLRAAAARALGHLRSSESVAMLAGLIADERDDLETLLAAINALGRLGDEDSVWALRSLLVEPLEERLIAGWRASLPPDARPTSPITWEMRLFSEPYQWRLLNALAFGETPADHPSSVQEIVAAEARQLRSVAIAAISDIGGSIARQVLGEVLQEHPPLGSEHLLAMCLASLGGVGELVAAAEQSPKPMVRLAATQALAQLSEGLPLLQRYISGPASDSFICGMLIESLVTSATQQAVIALEAIVCNEELTPELRAQAIKGLGTIEQSGAEGLMLSLISNSANPPELRSAAIIAAGMAQAYGVLPLLFGLLAESHPDPLVAVEALRVLGKSGAREAIPVLLRYAQSADADMASAAIDGLADLGDPTVLPVLVQISQAVREPAEVRLRAIGALVRLGGDENLPLLRYYLENGSLPMRMAALDLLLAAAPAPDMIGLDKLLVSDWPTPLRLRLLHWYLSCCSADLTPLIGLVAGSEESIQLRCQAAEALGRHAYAPALPVLIDLARLSSTPPQLRHRVIESLGAFEQPEALYALSELSTSDAPAIRTWATSGLAGQL